MVRCQACGEGKLVEKDVPYLIQGVRICMLKGLVCNTCREMSLDQETSRSIVEKINRFGLLGLG